MAPNSSTQPPPPSSLLGEHFSVSPAHTLPLKMARRNAPSAPSTTQFAPCCSTLPCRLHTGLRPLLPPATYSIGALPPPYPMRFPSLASMDSHPPTATFASLGAYATQTYRPPPQISSHLAPRHAFSLGIHPLIRVIGVLTWKLNASLFLAMLCSMRLFFLFPPPASSHSLAPWISF